MTQCHLRDYWDPNLTIWSGWVRFLFLHTSIFNKASPLSLNLVVTEAGRIYPGLAGYQLEISTTLWVNSPTLPRLT